MILKLSYNIRFPLGANFQSDPKYLFIKNIYKGMKNVICINKNHTCNGCEKKDNCLYYFLSGENFMQYPSILINREFVEKKNINKNENLKIELYLIGVACEYVGFIREFFDSSNKLGGFYFQKHIEKEEYIDDKTLYNGKLRFISFINSIEEISECLNYYNRKYNCNYPNVFIKDADIGMSIRDFNHYQINGKKINIAGYKMNLYVEQYPKIFLEIGIGKLAFLGGGKAYEN